MIKSIVNKWVFRAVAATPVAAFMTLSLTEFVTWGCAGGSAGGC